MLLSIEEYTQISRRIASRYAEKFKDDDDLIGSILYNLVMADLKNKENKEQYRYYRGRLALLKWLRLRKRHTRGIKKFLENKAEKDLWLYESYHNKELVEHLLKKSELTEEQLLSIDKYYMDGMSLKEIAKLCNCSIGTISYRIRTSLSKMRKVANAI